MLSQRKRKAISAAPFMCQKQQKLLGFRPGSAQQAPFESCRATTVLVIARFKMRPIGEIG
jgi:hypothetical protein